MDTKNKPHIHVTEDGKMMVRILFWGVSLKIALNRGPNKKVKIIKRFTHI